MPNSIILDSLSFYFISTHNRGSIDEHLESSIEKTPFSNKTLCTPIQVHSDRVLWVHKSGKYDKCDGLLTNISKNLTLSLSVADCIPIALYDGKTGNFGLVHAGWRGVIGNIVHNAIELMTEERSMVKDISCFFGPCISQRMYPVDYDVASKFSDQYYYKKKKKYFLDIRGQVISDIVSLGVLEDNILYSTDCTYTNREMCSYRRDGNNTGRNIVLMGQRCD